MTDKKEEFLLSQNKYIYGKDELKIAKSVCELCIYNDSENINVCIKFPKGKKQDILNNKVICPKLKRKNIVSLD